MEFMQDYPSALNDVALPDSRLALRCFRRCKRTHVMCWQASSQYARLKYCSTLQG